MTKNEYLEELRKELKNNNISEIDDIIADYNEHFTFKMEEGFTEEEIVKKTFFPTRNSKGIYAQNKCGKQI